MYRSWLAPTPGGSRREEMLLAFDRQRVRRVLVIPPLFDESNKFRRQIAETMRFLDRYDIDSLCPDLPGCNESLADFSLQTLSGWRSAAQDAAETLGATDILAFRSGAGILPGDLPGWQFEPQAPRAALARLVRAEVVAGKESAHPRSAEDILGEARERGAVLAGWRFGPAMIAEIEAWDMPAPDRQRVLGQSDVGGRPLWLRAENDVDPAQADTLASLVAAGPEAA